MFRERDNFLFEMWGRMSLFLLFYTTNRADFVYVRILLKTSTKKTNLKPTKFLHPLVPDFIKNHEAKSDRYFQKFYIFILELIYAR